MRAAEGHGDVPARAALAGNPSDGYGGAVLAVAVPEYRARAVAARATKLTVDPPSRLVRATVRRFAQAIEPAARDTAIRWTTSIPRAVGLGGSSAIVIAWLPSAAEDSGPVHSDLRARSERGESAVLDAIAELG